MNLLITNEMTNKCICDECKRDSMGVAMIEIDDNQFCLKCARDLNIITEDQLDQIKDYGKLHGGNREKAIQEALTKAN